MTKMTNIKALLFDLGGVVVNIDFGKVFSMWASLSNTDVNLLRQRFSMEAYYERHERGEIDIFEYQQQLLQRLGISLTSQQFIQGWNAVFNNYVVGIEEALDKAGQLYPLYCFTNTNQTHHLAWRSLFPAVEQQWFLQVFASWQIGKRKPERDAYLHVSDQIDCNPEQILFFDDSIQNVEGAKAAGMQAVLVRSTDDIMKTLSNIDK